MADPTPQAPAPQDPPAQPNPTDPPADPPKRDDPPDDGKGGKDAILADLAKERDKRQTLEQTVSEMQTAQQAQMDAIAKAFGIKQDDAPDPDALAQQIVAEQAKAREAALQLAVYRNAAAVEANPDLLLDSASFLRDIADLDPSDTEAVTGAIKSAVETNDRFKATQTPTSPPFPGGPRTPAPTRAGTLEEAVAARLASQTR